jgi:hypothetical protein
MNTQDQDKEKDKGHEKHNKLIGDGSPIMVGGGGGMGGDNGEATRVKLEGNIGCIFDEEAFPDPDPHHPGLKLFKRADSTIETFKIWTTTHGCQDFSGRLPADRDCTIRIHCRGDRDDVTIQGKDFGIEMDTRTYEKLGDPTLHRNPNGNSYIYFVELLHQGNETDHWNFDKRDDCFVCTDYMQNSTHCSCE